MSTVCDFSERRAARFPLPPSRLPGGDPDAPEWKLLAERTESVLASLEAIITASTRRRPGLNALRGDVAGLRYALVCAAQRRITVAAIHEASFAQGLAAARPQTRPVPAAPLRLHRDHPPHPLPGGRKR